MDRKLLGVILFGALLATAGCAMDVTVDSSVSSDATIETYEVELNMSTMVHSQAETQAQSAGYDSVGAYFLGENASVDQANADSVDISEEMGPNGNNTIVTIRMTGYDPAAESNISVREEGGTMIYEDVTFGPEGTNDGMESTPTEGGMSIDMDDQGSIEYTVEMPGEIQDTSAGATVSGDTATWDVDGDELYVYAESAVPEDSGDGGDGGDGGSSGLGPGFGFVGVVLALVLVSVALYRRND
jgi:hypothetical protein